MPTKPAAVAGPSRALWMSTIAFTVCFAVWTIFAIIGIQIKRELNLNETQFGLLVGTPILSLLGAIGAALTLGVRGGGSLLALLVLPLYVPVLIFGAGAADAMRAGLSTSAHFSLLAAGLLIALVGAPLATAAAVRIALD